jgi:phosphoribosylanthranilate isomerase
MIIKVCGLNDAENMQAVAALGPQYVGFICYERSPRYMAGIDTAALKNIPQHIIKTGVFVNEDAGTINKLIEKFGFNAVQLHGSESPEFCAQFKGKVKVLKAFGIDENFDFEQLKPYAPYADFFLFDTKTVIHGGSGKTFNWDILKNYTLDVPFFLSGGISTDNLAEIEKIDHPQLYGVDLNSRFETSPGIKNITLLKQAFGLIKQFNTHEIRS